MGFLMRIIGRITILIILLFNSLILTDIYASDNNSINNGYIILNLHWADGEITLNSMKKVVGVVKKTGRKAMVQPFLYTLLSDEGETIRAGYFKIPKKLHYDYFDESTGELKGGQLQRNELDFVIRVPSFHQAKQIVFHKTDRDSFYPTMNSETFLDESDDGELLGKINF